MSDRILNLTPHAINVYVGDECIKTLPSDGELRMSTAEQVDIGTLFGVPVKTSPTFKEIYIEHDPKDPDDVRRAEELNEILNTETGVVIVSMPVGEHVKMRGTSTFWPGWKVYGPDTSKDGAVRDDGRIIGTRGFVTYTY